MSYMNNYNKRERLEKVMYGPVKLTKSGEKFAKMDTKLLDNAINSNKKINYNEWLGISVNPNLSMEQIKRIYGILRQESKNEKTDTSIPKATATKNLGMREKIRVQLSKHSKLSEEGLESLIMSYRKGQPTVLDNPNITDKHLQMFFDKKVYSKADQDYSFVTFKKLMKSKNINTKLMLNWYNTLVELADWTYTDNNWYAIVSIYLQYDNCPIEILNDIASAEKLGDTVHKKDGSIVKQHPDVNNRRVNQYRLQAVEHKNATSETKGLAFEKTMDEEFAPDEVKDVFLF